MSWEEWERFAQEYGGPSIYRHDPPLSRTLRRLITRGFVAYVVGVASILLVAWLTITVAIGQLSVALGPATYPGLMDTPAPRCAMGERIVDWVCTTPAPGPTVGERP